MLFTKSIVIVSVLAIVLTSSPCSSQLSAKGQELREMGWDTPVPSPQINKTFAADVDDQRKTDLDGVIANMVDLFGGGFDAHFFITGTDPSLNQPVLDAAAKILGHTPGIGSYLSMAGTRPGDPRTPARVVFIEAEDEVFEHRLAVLVHEYYHVYQTANFLDEPERVIPPTWFMEGGAKLMETLYIAWIPNSYPAKQENAEQLLEKYKMYVDEESFEFGVALEGYEGINPPGTNNYDIAAGAMIYLAHLSSFEKVLGMQIYKDAYSLGWDAAFEKTFGMTATQFYESLNDAMATKTLAEVRAMKPSPSDLSEFMNRNGQMRGWSAPSWLLANLTTTNGQTPDRGDGLFVREGELVEIVLSGSDLDVGLTLSAMDLPEGASLSSDTFSWTPGYDLQGQMFSMTFTLSSSADGTGSASRTVHLFVEDVNRPVAIDAVQPPAGVVISSMGSTVKFTVDATDPEGDEITYAWTVNGELAHWFSSLSGETPMLNLELKSSAERFEYGPWSWPLIVNRTDLINVVLTVTGSDGTELSRSWSVIMGLVGDFDGDDTVGFSDFLLFAGVFGSNSASTSWDPKFDLDGDDSVGFTDFLIFVQYFGISL